jgi:glutamyl-tRNA synthetase
MGVTHAIRGDDHLNNAARQAQIYRAMGWAEPVWAHIPLIHGQDGKKLSKRHGATGVEEYAEMGIPARAMRNYLARLGWSHGDDEYFTDSDAVAWFDLDGIGKAPARLDMKKLENLSGQHLSAMTSAEVQEAVEDWARRVGETVDLARLAPAIDLVKEAARTCPQVVERAAFVLTDRPIAAEPKAAKALDTVSRGMLSELTPHLQTASWTRDALEAAVGEVASTHEVGLGKLAAPLRAALAGRTATPSVFDMMLVLGREESLARIEDAASGS